MQMVSATKMRRAQNQAISGRPYTSTLAFVLATVSKIIDPTLHKLLQNNDSSKVGVVLISTDKGLCGSLNTNLFRLINGDDLFKKEVIFYTIGKKGRDFLVRTKRVLEADFENTDQVHFLQATKLRKFLVEEFLNNKVGEVYLLYPDFISTLRQEAKLTKILPIDPVALSSFLESEKSKGEQQVESHEFLFEPDPSLVLDFALTHFLDTQIYQGFLESKASEHSARMIAMQNATNNAKDLVQDLNLAYNGLRQANITRELLEITSAGAALE